jgi:signal transduction histidine kinase
VLVIRIIFYLLQFYLFAASGTLAYLCARAWLDPSVAGRKRSGPKWMTQWSHFGQALAFAALTFAALLGAVYQGATGIHFDTVSVARILSYVTIYFLLSKSLRRAPKTMAAFVFLGIGEIVMGTLAPVMASPSLAKPIFASVCLALGMTFLGSAMKGGVFRVRVVDRLVIAFAVSSMIIAQVVVVLFLGLVFSIGDGISSDHIKDVVSHADVPVIITLAVVLVTSALIGYFLARDISAPMTRFERALRAIGEGELDYRVQLRGSGDDEMHDLAREVNRMAQRLKSAESVRAEFFSFVSHELRTPLTSIRGFIQTLEADPTFEEDDRAEIYGIIHDESDRLLRMIGELLDVARIEAGRPITLQTQRFDCVRHVEKVVEIMRAHTKRHDLVVERPVDSVMIEGDPDKFDQILINMLSNAIKYSPDGGTVTTTLVDLADSVTISVKDPGVGMTAAQTQHIFDKYYRVSDQDDKPSRLGRVEGAGIGLYLTRALAEAHGGKIVVQSQVGHGSTFTVTLPKVPAAQTVHQPVSASLEPTTPSETALAS